MSESENSLTCPRASYESESERNRNRERTRKIERPRKDNGNGGEDEDGRPLLAAGEQVTFSSYIDVEYIAATEFLANCGIGRSAGRNFCPVSH